MAAKPPVLNSIIPSTTIEGSPGFTLTVKGANFRAGGKVQWSSSDRPTTFVSDTELHATIAAPDVAAVKTVQVRVINPDGQVSGTKSFAVASKQPPVVVGFDELLIQNCNTNTISGSSVHRPIYIYYRAVGQNQSSPWVPINASPHDADYDSNGTCPGGPSWGARFALDDGVDYEVVCIDPQKPGCMAGDPNDVDCWRLPEIIRVHGKKGGGVKTVIVNCIRKPH